MPATSQTVVTPSTQRGFERSRIVQSARLGLVELEHALAWQGERAQAVAAGALPEIVVVMQHPPVYTQGRRGSRDHVLRPLDAPIIDTDRGGDITFHGPGQLVLWPILRLRECGIGVAAYVRGLEEVAIRTARHFGVEAVRAKGRPGVWVDTPYRDRKLASVGVRVQNGVSRHGMALNCDTDLAWFDAIRACGIDDASAASLSDETGRRVSATECAPVLEQAFSDVFDLRLSPVAVNAAGELPA